MDKYLFENDNGEDIELVLSASGELSMTMFFNRTFSEEEMLKFANDCGFKLKKAPLRRVK